MQIKPNILDYLDYRDFLSDYYKYKKSIDPSFTYRKFAEICQIRSHVIIINFIKGQRNVTEGFRKKLSAGCELTTRETDYFSTLIDYNHAKDLEIKNQKLKELYFIARSVLQKDINEDQKHILSNWYYLVIRALINNKNSRTDIKLLLKKLRYWITEKELTDTLYILSGLGIIEERNGKYYAVDKHIKMKDGIAPTAVDEYHSKIISLGLKALKEINHSDREMRSITIDISEHSFEKIVLHIQSFF